MLDRIDQNRPRAMAEAIMSPSALLLAGAGASAAILAGVPLLAAAGVAAVAWAGRVALALPKKPRKERVDPGSLREPWRTLVREAMDAAERFDEAVRVTTAGPLRDRLAEVGARIQDGVRESWGIARRGDALERAVRQRDVPTTMRELAEVEGELRVAPRPDLQATADSLRRQIDSCQRLQSVAQDARDRLRRLDAQLDESVARAVELSLNAADLTAVSPLGSDVESLVGELESLRQALEETGGTGTVATA